MLKYILSMSSEGDVFLYLKRLLICTHNLASVSRSQIFPQHFEGPALSLSHIPLAESRVLSSDASETSIPNTRTFHKNRSKWGSFYSFTLLCAQGDLPFSSFLFVFKNFLSIFSILFFWNFCVCEGKHPGHIPHDSIISYLFFLLFLFFLGHFFCVLRQFFYFIF